MLVEICEKGRWIKCDPLANRPPPRTEESFGVAYSRPYQHFRGTCCIRLVYHKTGLFCVRRLAPPRSIGQLRFNDRQLTCDKSRLRTADSVKVCHSPILHLRSKESTHLTERGFFLVWYCAKVYRLTPKYKDVVYK